MTKTLLECSDNGGCFCALNELQRRNSSSSSSSSGSK